MRWRGENPDVGDTDAARVPHGIAQRAVCRLWCTRRPAHGTLRDAVWHPAHLAVVAIAASCAVAFADTSDTPLRRVDLKHQLDAIVAVHVELDASGKPVYVLTQGDGTVERLNPDQFARRLLTDHDDRPWWKRVLNITSPVGIAWVTLGLLGQVLFTGRMIVQWLASEKHKRSVVPPVFWWMSLVGATMLLVYFAWRKDIVGLLGQATGWAIYVRNLMLIYRPGAHPPGSDPTIADDPGPEPELSEE